jgi:hypothetical protein
MASTLKLQDSINWARPFLKNQPLDFSNMEPALTTGNVVLQTIISAPFKWRFNRGSFDFTTVPAVAGSAPTPAQCDYPLTLPDFGYLEDQWLTVPSSGKVWPLTGAFSLQRATGDASRPTQLAAQYEDSSGTVTMRTKEMPDKAYQISGDYQKKAVLLTSVASLVGPLPDDFAFLFNWGFLTVASMLVNDSRFAVWEKYFIGRLFGLQSGLSEVDRNIFLGLWSANLRTASAVQSSAQMGAQGRGQ